MVRATLDDRKTNTRRVAKCFPSDGFIQRLNSGDYEWSPDGGFDRGVIRKISPYGQPGDHLWVRETFAETESDGGPVIVYRAGGSMVHGVEGGDGRIGTGRDIIFPGEVGEVYPPDKWKPSIFMPKWASRITLEIIAVRVERVQEISAKDIIAEGAVLRPHHHAQLGKMPVSAFDNKAYVDLRSLWAAGWNQINGKRAGCSWSDNPFCWVLEFRRIDKETR